MIRFRWPYWLARRLCITALRQRFVGGRAIHLESGGHIIIPRGHELIK